MMNEEEVIQLNLLAAHEEIPQASNTALLVTLVGALGRDAADGESLATLMEVEPRTVAYYLDLARWLGLVRRGGDGPELAPAGWTFYESVAARGRLFAEAVMRRETVKLAMQLAEGGGEALSLREACRRAIVRGADLSASTARRRASSLASLIEVARHPSRIDWASGERLEAYRRAALEFEGESFLSACGALDLGVPRRLVVGFSRQVWVFVCGGGGEELEPTAWRRASFAHPGGGLWFGSVPMNPVTRSRVERGGRYLRELLLVCVPAVTLLTVLLALRDPLERSEVRLTRDMYGLRLWHAEEELGSPLEVLRALVERMGLVLEERVPSAGDGAAEPLRDAELVEVLEVAGFIRRRDTVYELAPGVLKEWHDDAQDAPSAEERLAPIQRRVRASLRAGL